MSILSDIINAAKEVVEVARTTAQGMSVTFSHIPTRKETVQYPDEPVQIYRRFRGEHFLDVDEEGKEKCVSCFLCAAARPAPSSTATIANGPSTRPARWSRTRNSCWPTNGASLTCFPTRSRRSWLQSRNRASSTSC